MSSDNRAVTERRLLAAAEDQHGVFTLKQAVATGLSPRTIQDRAKRGRYTCLYPGVYAVAGVESSHLQGVFAAVAATTEPAAASHRTAAYLWSLVGRRPSTIDVVTRRHRRVQRLDYVVHESKDLLAGDIKDLDGIAITSPVRTVVDLGATSPKWMVERALDTGIRKGLFSAWDVRCFIARVGRPGRAGVGVARPFVEERLLWTSRTESELEDRFRRLAAATGFPIPQPQLEVRDRSGLVGRFDFAYPSEMVLIELDSKRWHMDPGAFERDREKQNRAQALGWTVYRFTWHQVVGQPEAVRDVLASIHAT